MKALVFIVGFLYTIIGFSQEKELVKFDPNKKYTQKYIDSLIVAHRAATVKRMEISDFKKMLESNDELFGWTYYYFGKAAVSFRKKELDSSLFYANKGIDIYNKIKNKREVDHYDLLLLHYYKGEVFRSQKDLEQAIEAYQIALDLSKEYPYQLSAAITASIGNCHVLLENYEFSLKYYLEVEKDENYMRIPRGAGTTFNHISGIYEKLEQYELAKEYAFKSIEVAKNSNYKGSLASSYEDLSEVYLHQQKLDSSEYYAEKALDAFKKYGQGNSILMSLSTEVNFKKIEAKKLISKGQIEEGLALYIEAKDTLFSVPKIDVWQRNLSLTVVEALASIYEDQNSPKELTKLMDETIEYISRFHQQQQEINLSNLEVKYQTKEKDFEIAQLEQTKKQQQLTTLGIVGFFLLISGFAVVLWRQSKLKTQYEKENLEQRLLRLQMNPHFIGNAMNTINALVEKRSDNTQKYVNNLSKLFRLILINSREEFVSLEDEVATINSYLLLESNFSKKFDFSLSVGKDIDVEATVIPPMLIQPLIENAITHGLIDEAKGLIDIEINKSDKHNMLICRIKDNGKGYSEKDNSNEGKQTSISGNIIRERIKILKAKFKLDLKLTIEKLDNSGGTDAKLYLPYLLD